MQRLDQRDLDGVLALCADNCTFYGFAPMPLDNDGYRQAITEFLNGFPDSRFPVYDTVAEGNRVALRHALVGTHNGTFQGIPATGRSVRVEAIAMMEIENGKAVNIWLSADILGLLQQLGVVPTPGQ